MSEIHVLNLGAGIQSTAIYLMACANLRSAVVPYPRVGPITVAIFADTGEEPVAVYSHLSWLQSLKEIPILVRRKSRLGDDLARGVHSTGQRFASIPAFTDGIDGAGQSRRQCSMEYKIEVIERCIRRELLDLKPRQRAPKGVVRQYFGISIEESGRADRIRRRSKWSTAHFPLLNSFMSRQDCIDWLYEQGSVPHEVPRSACVFCPYHSDAEWLRIKSVPEDWKRAVAIDDALRVPGNIVNRNMEAKMYVHRSLRPLSEVQFSQSEAAVQPSMGFYRECLGVCGL